MGGFITLDHGSGGKKTSELIEKMMLPAFENKELYELGDGAVITLGENKKKEASSLRTEFSKIVFSTDSFVVSPYFFPGGDIGKLAVCGTVNDLAVSGAIPEYISLGIILEEGMPMDDLERIVLSAAETAKSIGVKIVTGDTKVVEKGKGDGIYINTSGIGSLKHTGLSPEKIEEGDSVIVSGPIGDHGISILLARNPGFMETEILSDCAPISKIAEALFVLGDDLKVMRDPTRGGVATTLCEFLDHSEKGTAKDKSGICIELNEKAVPVGKQVAAACDILGIDPLYSACEGRLIAVVSASKTEEALSLIRGVSGKEDAQCIGTVTTRYPGKLVLNTKIGGTRILSKLAGSQMPRIC